MGDVLNRFEILIKKTYYIHDRYNVEATFGLLYHEPPLTVQELGRVLRISDELIPLDEHQMFIIFTFTAQANAIKASQNVLQKLDHHFNNTTSCIALDRFDTAKSAPIVLGRLRQILAETCRRSFARIENESILDGRM